MCVCDACSECVCCELGQRDPVAGSVKDPSLIDWSKLKHCLYLGEVGGDCKKKKEQKEVHSDTAGRDKVSHTLIKLSLTGCTFSMAHPAVVSCSKHC